MLGGYGIQRQLWAGRSASVGGGLNNTDGGGNRVADGLVRQEQGVV